PRLKGEFFLFSEKAWGNPREASKIVNFSRYGENVRLDDIPVIDLVVVGSVAVSPRGNRVGKGEGYSELEYAILREQGKVKETTPVATTVHSIQIVPDVPSEPFDVPVDIIATESSLIKTDGLEKPKGLILEYLTREKVNDTPYLMEYLRRTNRLHLIT
ncbi:MAG: 5-formyltetrahydrofolate cyclo-ligase, partial [Metallosphaera sp.]